MFVLFLINIVNILLIIFMVIVEHKRLNRVAIWLLIFSCFPILGFVFYILFGVGVISRKQKKALYLNKSAIRKKIEIENREKSYKEFDRKIDFNLLNNGALLLKNEKIDIFTSGQDYFFDLEKEIRNSKRNIYISSYIIKDDYIGRKLLNLLVQKSKQNVDIIIIYDAFGSKFLSKKFKKKCKINNIKLFGFFPSLFKIPFLQTKLNYRNHRKIVIIDNEISYIGGINFRKDHFGYDKKLFPWKDTQVKIVGETTMELLNIFLKDLNLCTKNYSGIVQNIKNDYNGEILTSVINCGPLDVGQKIEESFIDLINNARDEILIESPYLILDDKIFETLKIASLKGVKVKIFIPQKPDRNAVYMASLFHCKRLLEVGVEVYLYKGFLHSKCLTIDNEIFVVGSCNFDMRSFYLNFETSIVIFNSKLCKLYKDKIDKKNYEKLSLNDYKKMPVHKKLAISFFQLFSPIM